MRVAIDPRLKNKTIFIKSFIGGLGWMTGATVGFALLLTILSLVLRWLGGLPLIGDFFADLISTTQEALKLRRGH